MDSKNTHVSIIRWGTQAYVSMTTNVNEHCARSDAYQVIYQVRYNPVYRGGCQPRLVEAVSNIEDWKQWVKTVDITTTTFTDKSSAAAFKNTLMFNARRNGFNVLNKYNANADRIEGR